MTKLRVKWVKSAIGYPKDQKATIRALGLRKLQHTVEHDDQPHRVALAVLHRAHACAHGALDVGDRAVSLEIDVVLCP